MFALTSFFDQSPNKNLLPSGQSIPSGDLRERDKQIRPVENLLANSNELLRAVKFDGNMQALKALCSISSNVDRFYSFLPKHISQMDRLQFLFDAAMANNNSAFRKLFHLAKEGQVWGAYGLEMLAGQGKIKAQNYLEELILNRDIKRSQLWRSPEYQTRFEAFIEKTGRAPKDHQLLMYLLPMGMREVLEEEFVFDGNIEGEIRFQDLIPFMHQVFLGYSDLPKEFRNRVRHEVKVTIEGLFFSPPSQKMLVVLAKFVSDYFEDFKEFKDDPIIQRAKEILERKRLDLL